MGRTETEPERKEASDLAVLYRNHVRAPEKDPLVIHLANETDPLVIHLANETYPAIAVLSPQQKQNLTIGRSSQNDVVVGKLSVSGKHAEFKVEADMSVVVRCCGRNSTWVQSAGEARRRLCQNVWSRPLLEGDTLTLGDVDFVITFGTNACMQNLNELTTAITLKGQIIWEAFKMPRGKGVENRSVRVGPGWVAVHVGKGKHDEELVSQYRRALPDLSSDDSLKGFVAGLVWISRTIRESDLRNELSCSCNGAGHEESCPMNPFITGPFCSIVKVIVPLSTPIKADGQMNEWRLPRDVSESILAQLSENDKMRMCSYANKASLACHSDDVIVCELGDSHDAPLVPLPQTPRVNAVSDDVQAKACPQTPQRRPARKLCSEETDSQETSQDGSPPKAGDGSDVERKTTTPVCLKRWFTDFPSPAYDFGSRWDCAGVLTHMASVCMLTRGRDCFRTCAIFPARDVDAHRTPPAESDRRFVDTWLALLGTRSGDTGHWALLCLRPPFGERLEWDVVLLDRQQSPAMRLKARQYANDFGQFLNFNDFPTEAEPDELAIQQQNGAWECGLLAVDDARRCLEVPLNIPLRSQLPLFQLPPLNLLLVCMRAMRHAIEPDLAPEKALAEPPRKKSRVSLGKEISVEPVVVSKRAQTDSLKKKRRFPFAEFAKRQRATSAELQGLRADAQNKVISEMWKSLSPEMRASWL